MGVEHYLQARPMAYIEISLIICVIFDDRMCYPCKFCGNRDNSLTPLIKCIAIYSLQKYIKL
ncbi:hypothetical protein SAMN05192562_101287 [Kosakonia arachidis]|uniref:Uncharacterized protein n=1 Tax=Kosakonia arachidis TaxID=551989 RepID=A0A1I6Y0D7_9ENTR|nr:hypothetical protein SAMN05192562_101287 [Kosakonia arachidis]